MGAGKDIAVRALDTRDSLDAWEADLDRIEEGMRCERVLAWAGVSGRVRMALLKRLTREMDRVQLEMCIGRRP